MRLCYMYTTVLSYGGQEHHGEDEWPLAGNRWPLYCTFAYWIIAMYYYPNILLEYPCTLDKASSYKNREA